MVELAQDVDFLFEALWILDFALGDDLDGAALLGAFESGLDDLAICALSDDLGDEGSGYLFEVDVVELLNLSLVGLDEPSLLEINVLLIHQNEKNIIIAYYLS